MVAKLIDGYLAEVAPDENLKLTKFRSLAAAIPEYARPIDDGLYRAIDIYLKVTIFHCCSLSVNTVIPSNVKFFICREMTKTYCIHVLFSIIVVLHMHFTVDLILQYGITAIIWWILF